MVDKKDDTETLLEFPCQYTLKVIGRTSKDFEAEAVRIVREHFPNLGEGAISLKQSKESNYLALSISLWVEDKPSLDALYEALSQSPHTIFVL